MAKYKLVEIKDNGLIGRPVGAATAQANDPAAFDELYRIMTALMEKDEARAAGQLDMFARPTVPDADKLTDQEIWEL